MTDTMNQEFPLAAPGVGVICFTHLAGAPEMRVFLSRRAPLVGAGWGITSGGFVEVGDVLCQPVGFVQDVLYELSRELAEELGPDVIAAQDLLCNAQPLGGFNVRTADANRVHAAQYYAYRVSPQEEACLLDLTESTEERDGSLLVATLRWYGAPSARNAEGVSPYLYLSDQEGELIRWEEFHWAHEREAFLKLAWFASRGRLWNES